jgi:PhoPQ-activated pathogenicity-related protein
MRPAVARAGEEHMIRHTLVAFACAMALAGCGPAEAPAPAAVEAPAAIDLSVKDDEKTALDVYIAKPDPAYKWELVGTYPGDGQTTFVLEMTSQTWRTEADVDKPVWKHWMTIVKPDGVKHDKALLFIWQGDNTDPAPTKAQDRSIRMAKETGSVVAEVGMVPNQPLRFTDSADTPRWEDDIIAYTRVKHFTTKDDEWLVRLAMVKAGVKALDATQEFMKSEVGGGVTINQFVVSGASKRGWATWLVGAVDERVIGIMPLVIDALNSEEITKHHFEVLGFFAPSLDDYVNHGLFPHKIGTPEYQEVLRIEDAYHYRDRARLTIPKFIINASGDQFFLPDNSRFYYEQLPQEKRLRYVENAAHNLAGSDAVDSMLAWYNSVITGGKRPDFIWNKVDVNGIAFRPLETPKEVKLWQAHNPKARDFRIETVGPIYTSTVLTPQDDGTYFAQVPMPTEGFTAFFVEATFDSGLPAAPFKFTTEVSIIPDTLPFKWADAAAKYAATAPR